eukprot:3442978-Karenia_brevis.AAC.1
MFLSEQARLATADYPFRPVVLAKFPMYFFLAGCEATRTLSSDSMDWVPLLSNGEEDVLHQR